MVGKVGRVLFVDQWDEQIAWVNPERLYATNAEFSDLDPQSQKRLTRLISIDKIREFAVLCDKLIDKEERARIESVDFLSRVPVGVYQFRILVPNGMESEEKVCEIFVYDNLLKSYQNMIANIPGMFSARRAELENAGEELTDEELWGMSDNCKVCFFEDVAPYLAFNIEDIDNLIRYYFQTSMVPTFYKLQDREKYDVDALARHIVVNRMDPIRQKQYIQSVWDATEDGWDAFFDYNWKCFKNEVGLAVEKLISPEDYVVKEKPKETFEDRRYEDLSMHDIAIANRKYGQELRNEVYKKYTDKDGCFFSALSGFRSRNRADFEVDHIVPMEHGGKTCLDNLQLLTVKENRQKGTRQPIEPIDVHDEVAKEDVDRELLQRRAMKLRVVCADGKIIASPKATDTFVEAVEYAGLDNVISLCIMALGDNLVSDRPNGRYGQRQASDGRFITTNFSTKAKMQILEKIGNGLSLGWRVELVPADN